MTIYLGQGIQFGSAAAQPVSAFEQALVATPVQASAYQASPGDEVLVDISSGNVTVSLPNAPADGSRVGIKVVTVNATPGTYTATWQTQGSDFFNVASGSTSLTYMAKFQGAIAKYKASTKLWTVTATDVPVNVALGAARLGSDGTIGGPSGSSLTSSVVSATQLVTSGGVQIVADTLAHVQAKAASLLASGTPYAFSIVDSTGTLQDFGSGIV